MTIKSNIESLKKGLEDKIFIKKGAWWKWIPFSSYFIKDKNIKVVIINEDTSTNEYMKGLPKSYVFEIEDKSYFMVPKCILKLDVPTIFYYFNNPFPVYMKFTYSQFKPVDLKDEEALKLMSADERLNLGSVSIDAESLNLAFNTRFIRGLYYGEGMSTKTILYIVGAVGIGILVVLQLTGTVDVMGQLNNVLIGEK